MAARTAARSVLLGLVLLACFAGGSGAQTPGPCGGGEPTALLMATTNYPGIIVLHYVGAHGATVTYYECEGQTARLLGTASTPDETTDLSPATWWRCDRLARRFAATVTLPDGTTARGSTDVRTMSCAHRFELRVPERVKRGGRASVRIVDRWSQGGVRAALCVTPPGATAHCRAVNLPVGVNVVRRSVRVRASGRWRIELKAPKARLRSVIAVGRHARPFSTRLPTVLATGDSTMMGTESFLADDMDGHADVVSQVSPGAAIGLTDNWLRLARRQVRRWHPATTVLSIGANEGWPLPAPGGGELLCCDARWAAAFERRLEIPLRTYLQGGRGRVMLLTQPAPRDPDRVPMTDAVNQAIVATEADLEGVRVLRMDLLFSPGGYQETIRFRGRDVHVREPDGVHLNVAGTAIAAGVVADALLGRAEAPLR